MKGSGRERYLYSYPDSGRFKIGVCYPNSYAVGMSNLGFQSLFHRTASYHGLRVARFFLERDGELFSPEAQDPRKTELFPSKRVTLRGFDALFFSISFELDYTGVLAMLKLSGIPLRAGERVSKPFILMGGITVSANPAIMSIFSDALFIGDMEEGLEDIVKILIEREFRKSVSMFDDLAAVPGVFLSRGTPGEEEWGERKKREGQGGRNNWYRAVTKVITEPAHTAVITRHTEFSGMFLVEIVRGCRNTCNFCMTRCVSGPARSVRKEAVLEAVRRALPYTRKVGLIGPVLTDNKALPGIVEGINGFGATVSFSSLRADAFDEQIAALLEKNSQTTLTFAPETGSLRLSERIGKRMQGERILHAVSVALRHGVRNFRYYLMYGLPGETGGDIRLTAELVLETVRLLESTPGASLHLSVNPFVPKKLTPFERERIWPRAYYERVKGELSEMLGGEPGWSRKGRGLRPVTAPGGRFPPQVLSMRFESLRLLPLHYLLSVGGEEAGSALSKSVSEGNPKILERCAEEFAFGGESNE